MLMDLFHSTLPPQFQDSRRRVHFHAFMIDVHKRNHAYKVKFGETGDRMGEVARDLAREARILSFDEFQVSLCRPSPRRRARLSTDDTLAVGCAGDRHHGCDDPEELA